MLAVSFFLLTFADRLKPNNFKNPKTTTRMKDLQMYINGQFCESSNGKWIDVLNPSTEEVISRQPEGTIEDVNRALDAARAAQKQGAKTPAIERAQ